MTSPGDALDAVSGVTNAAGAVTPFVTYVYVVPKGRPAAGAPVFAADRVEGLSVGWAGPRRLKIHALKADYPDWRRLAKVGWPQEMRVMVEAVVDGPARP